MAQVTSASKTSPGGRRGSTFVMPPKPNPDYGLARHRQAYTSKHLGIDKHVVVRGFVVVLALVDGAGRALRGEWRGGG